MTQPVTLPLWLLILILAFAAVTALSHFLLPSVRWFFRKRMERVVARLNTRLKRPIEPFKLARRHDMIQRLVYDPAVSEAVAAQAHSEGIPENVAFEQARRYAREIVPSFSATMYFGFGTRLARWFSRAFYDIRIDGDVGKVLSETDPDATVIFVINHRSNMDYVLVTWLIAKATALSYAVGEWARVWPLSSVIRMMGAFFIRRKSRGPLYRRVLATYVRMSTRGGVTQAFFPEGRLSLTGGLGEPRLGLMNYVLTDYDPSVRDVVFVPVALNYDRVLEDRILIGAAHGGRQGFRLSWTRAAWATVGHLFQRLARRFRGFGTATVAFGTPLALSDWQGKDVELLAEELMRRIAEEVPILPVPLVSWLLLHDQSPLPERVAETLRALKGGVAALPHGTPEQIVERGVEQLRVRGLLQKNGHPKPDARPILQYYAQSIDHHMKNTPLRSVIAASAK